VAIFRSLLFSIFAFAISSGVSAQNAEVGFGVVSENKGEPVEVTADSLAVDQATGQALFAGSVVIVQGEMRLSANEVLVFYSDGPQGVDRVEATGDVILISGEDVAESERADYDVAEEVIVMTGNVLLVQGPSTLTADKMTVQLDSGTAQMSGRVKTIFQSEDN
jgi:lipopolysaccharide export system protein LptA